VTSNEPRDPDRDETEIVLSQSKAFVPLLVLFGITVLGVVVTIVRSKPFVPPVGAAADHAYGPADFKERLAQFDPIEGLDRAATGTHYPVPKPPFSEGAYPCSECHEPGGADPTRRKLEMAHEEIVLEHDQENRWCLDCHDQEHRDSLRLASGALIPFEESYRLCGQCHGTQFRDWKSGIHGKRTGYWDGAKRYLLCVHCHNPHSPKYMDLTPFPPPVRPQFLTGPPAAPAAPSSEEESHG
jgi:hypothetical protein